MAARPVMIADHGYVGLDHPQAVCEFGTHVNGVFQRTCGQPQRWHETTTAARPDRHAYYRPVLGPAGPCLASGCGQPEDHPTHNGKTRYAPVAPETEEVAEMAPTAPGDTRRKVPCPEGCGEEFTYASDAEQHVLDDHPDRDHEDLSEDFLNTEASAPFTMRMPKTNGGFVVAGFMGDVVELVDKKSVAYGDAWLAQGYMGNLARILSKTERLRNMMWRDSPHVVLRDTESIEDTLTDLAALCAFALENLNRTNRWGRGSE